MGRKGPDKSGNYKNLEVKGFENATNECEAKTKKPLSLARGNWRKGERLPNLPFP
jgi:hypothetical protein